MYLIAQCSVSRYLIFNIIHDSKSKYLRNYLEPLKLQVTKNGNDNTL